MIVLDTNVISELMQDKTNILLVEWLNAQPQESIWTTSVCIYEILYGINILEKGRRKRSLEKSFEKIVDRGMKGRILGFDAVAAKETASIAAKLKSKGRSVEVRDIQIAGIVSVRHGTLATRNTRHFAQTGVSVLNPWKDGPA